jgi:glyoxylase-like metal-dependent hydrolase (beta-lactamase superfamily II)
MTPVFANSGHVPARENLVLRGGSRKILHLPVRYGLYISPQAGPVLIDTGYSEDALVLPNRSLFLRIYAAMMRPRLNPADQITPFLARHHLRPADITHIIVTHFHVDHVSALRALPQARVIASRAAWQDVSDKGKWANLRHGVFPELLPADLQARLRFAEDGAAASWHGHQTHDIFGDGAVLALPLPGHAAGHLGLIFAQLPRPLLYATDTAFLPAALPAHARPGLPASLIAQDKAAAARSCDLVLQLHQQGHDLLLCHDPAASPWDAP